MPFRSLPSLVLVLVLLLLASAIRAPAPDYWFLRRQRGLSQRCIAFGFVSRSWVVLSFIGSGRIVDYTQFGHGLCGTRGQVRQQISTRAGVSYGPATELRYVVGCLRGWIFSFLA